MTTYIFAGAMTINGTPVNQKRFDHKSAADKFRQRSNGPRGFWSLVKSDDLAPTFQNCVVYAWKEESIQRLEDVLLRVGD